MASVYGYTAIFLGAPSQELQHLKLSPGGFFLSEDSSATLTYTLQVHQLQLSFYQYVAFGGFHQRWVGYLLHFW